LGDLHRAVKNHEQAREIFLAELGEEHPATCTAENYLGNSWYALGQYEQAKQLYKQTLEKRNIILGPIHQDTLESRNNLANCYAKLGRLDRAIALEEETLQLQRQHLGDEHPDTLGTRNNLAMSYAELRRFDEAVELQRETIDILERQLNREHPDLLSARHNLANFLLQTGQTQDALSLYLDVYEMRREHLGKRHPGTWESIEMLGVAYGIAGELEEAVIWSQLAWDGKLAALGPNHQDTVNALSNLAMTNQRLGRLEEATAQFEELFSLYTDHPNLGARIPARVRYGLAACNLASEQIERALEIIDESVELARQDPEYHSLLPHFVDLRVQHFVKHRDSDGLLKTAEIFESFELASIEQCLTAARLRVLVAAFANWSDDEEEVKKNLTTDPNATMAIEHLRSAVDHGFTDAKLLTNDPILQNLNNLPDYVSLLSKLDER
jgi:tetratricopeptide (TPR) repeat protein